MPDLTVQKLKRKLVQYGLPHRLVPLERCEATKKLLQWYISRTDAQIRWLIEYENDPHYVRIAEQARERKKDLVSLLEKWQDGD